MSISAASLVTCLTIRAAVLAGQAMGKWEGDCNPLPSAPVCRWSAKPMRNFLGNPLVSRGWGGQNGREATGKWEGNCNPLPFAPICRWSAKPIRNFWVTRPLISHRWGRVKSAPVDQYLVIAEKRRKRGHTAETRMHVLYRVVPFPASKQRTIGATLS